MHLLIPYAYCHQEACRQAFHRLTLPKLRQLLTRLQADPAADTDGGDEWTLSPPHERVQARALGLPSGDGRIPWAAWQTLQAPPQQLAPLASHDAWGFLSPCHWQAGMDRLTMQGPDLPELNEAESRALMGTLAEFMQQDGIALHFDRARPLASPRRTGARATQRLTGPGTGPGPGPVDRTRERLGGMAAAAK